MFASLEHSCSPCGASSYYWKIRGAKTAFPGKQQPVTIRKRKPYLSTMQDALQPAASCDPESASTFI